MTREQLILRFNIYTNVILPMGGMLVNKAYPTLVAKLHRFAAITQRTPVNGSLNDEQLTRLIVSLDALEAVETNKALVAIIDKTIADADATLPVAQAPPVTKTMTPIQMLETGAVASADAITPPSPPAAAEAKGDNLRYTQYADYLKAIFKPGDTVCVTLIEHSKKKGAATNHFTTLDDALTLRTFENLERANNRASVYVGMNTYPESLIGKHDGRTQENVKEIRTLYADLDANGIESLNAILSSSKVPRPSIIVESSTGKRQVIWLVDGVSKDQAKTIMQAIAEEFDGDPMVAETARVMRAPGFINRKPEYSQAPLARLLENNGARYTATDFHVDLMAKPATPASSDEGDRAEIDLTAPFIHRSIDGQLVSFLGYYFDKGIKDPNTLYRIMVAHIEENGCFELDKTTPRTCNMERVRWLCENKPVEWEAKLRQEAEKNLADAAKITEAALEAMKQMPPAPPATMLAKGAEITAAAVATNDDKKKAINAAIEAAIYNPSDPTNKDTALFCYDGLITKGHLVLWLAPVKGEKSLFALRKAMHDACGRDWLNCRNLVGPEKVFYFDTENSKSDFDGRYTELIAEFSPREQILIGKNLKVELGKELEKLGIEIEYGEVMFWDVLKSKFAGAQQVYIDCWYDIHSIKAADNEMQKKALRTIRQYFPASTLYIIQHVGRESAESLAKKRAPGIRELGAHRWSQRIAQGFVLMKKAETFICQEKLESTDEDGGVEEYIDLQVWSRSIHKIPLLTFRPVYLDENDNELKYKRVMDDFLSPLAMKILTRLQGNGPWATLGAVLKEAGHGGKQKTAIDELKFKGYLVHTPSGWHAKRASRDLLMSSAILPSVVKDTRAFLLRVLTAEGVADTGLDNDTIQRLAASEGVILGTPLMYKEAVKVTKKGGKDYWTYIGEDDDTDGSRLMADVEKAIAENPTITIGALTEKLKRRKVRINEMLKALGYTKGGKKSGAWIKEAPARDAAD